MFTLPKKQGRASPAAAGVAAAVAAVAAVAVAEAAPQVCFVAFGERL